jgi:hypothetical protein
VKNYTVNIGGRPVKHFTNKTEATKFMVEFMHIQLLQTQSLAYLDEAVLKSDMSESKAVINYIMEMK